MSIETVTSAASSSRSAGRPVPPGTGPRAGARCHDTLKDDRCERPAGHDGFHHAGLHTWCFRDVPEPAWRTRARFGQLAAKEFRP